MVVCWWWFVGGGLLVVVCWWWIVGGGLLGVVCPCGSLPRRSALTDYFCTYTQYFLRDCNKILRRFSAREMRRNLEGCEVFERWFATRNKLENNPMETLHSVKKDF